MRWKSLLDRRDVLIVDTETTGLDGTAEIIEIAMLDTTGEPHFEALALPAGRVPAAAAAVHGLTREALEAGGARPWPAIHGAVVERLLEARYVLAWNAPFDRRMLQQTAKRHGLPPTRCTWLDLLPDYRAMRKGRGRNRLEQAAAREEVTAGTAHRAMGDCRTVLAVMRAVVERGGPRDEWSARPRSPAAWSQFFRERMRYHRIGTREQSWHHRLERHVAVRSGANEDDTVFFVGAADYRTTYEIRLLNDDKAALATGRREASKEQKQAHETAEVRLQYHRFGTRERHRIEAIVFHGVEGDSAVFVVHADDGLTYEIRVWVAAMGTVLKAARAASKERKRGDREGTTR